jgi:ABC-type Na+ transport system ATPase subunit NatA
VKRGGDDSDFEQERSPSPVPASQKLLDRQKELKQSWKRLAATQRLVLNAIAGRTQTRLTRDKTAHRKAEEFEEVQEGLQAALEKKLESLGNEYRLRVEMAQRILEGQQQIIKDRFEVSNGLDTLTCHSANKYRRMQLMPERSFSTRQEETIWLW